MKKLLLLVLLASCTSAPTEDPMQKAVSAYLRQTMNDPSSYQPVHWDAAEVRTVHDSVAVEHHLLASQIHITNQYVSIDSASIASLANKGLYAQSLLKETRSRLAIARRKRDSLYQAYHQPYPTPDTAKLGHYITHSFRSKNTLGAIVLDSAEFYVDRAGRVTPH